MSPAATKMAIVALVGLAIGWTGGAVVKARAEAQQSVGVGVSVGASGTVGAGARAVDAIVVPHVDGIAIDGEMDDPGWPRAALAGTLEDERGAIARPYSDVRIARDDHNMYLTLYCADEDLRPSDTVHVALGAVSFDAHPTGKLDGAPAGVLAAADVDGTIDDARDDDEEWVVEVAIPIAQVGAGVNVPIEAKRCDTLKDGSVRCGRLTRTLSLR